MAWDGVPWFVGGGAEHSPEVARLLSYAAFGGAEGIVGSGDLRVREREVPDDTVRVSPGACAILNRASAQEYQAYAARLPSEETVEISSTDSSGGRSDLIVARVEDPYLSGEPWDEPDDEKSGPYVYTRVISDVPSDTRSLQDVEPDQSGIALARIDIPASTGTIEQNMIVDLRQMVSPRSEQIQKIRNETSTGEDLDSSSFVTFSDGAEWDVEIPSWATNVQILGNVAGYLIDENSTDGGNVFGDFRISLGGMTTASTRYNYSLPEGLGQIDAGASFVADDLSIPSGDRGATRTLTFEGRRSGGSTDCVLRVGGGQVTAIQLRFYEAPDDA